MTIVLNSICIINRDIANLNEVKIVNVNGTNILYNESKEKTATTTNKHVLFIHGLGSSSIVWRDIPDALAEHFHTIAVDLIGFGRSDKPKTADYTIKGLSKFIMDFLREGIKIKKHEKINIVGHSLGGYIAAEFAIDNKNLIEKIVLIDSSGMLQKPTPLLVQYLDAAMEKDSILRYKKVQRVFEDLLADRSRLLPVVADIFIGTIGKSGAKYAFESAFHNSTTTQIGSDRLKQIEDIPCLIIWGEKDNLIPSDYAKEFQKVLRNVKVEIIRDAGHSPFAEKTALVYEMLRSFLMNENKTSYI